MAPRGCGGRWRWPGASDEARVLQIVGLVAWAHLAQGGGSSAVVGGSPVAPPGSIAAECLAGCAVKVELCASSPPNPGQRWGYSPSGPASLVLAEGVVNATVGLCLNVKRMGTAAGDECWVTLCHPEHPLSANEGWAFTPDSELANQRSHLCAVASSTGAVTLGKCGSGQRWQFDAKTGQVSVSTSVAAGASLGEPRRGSRASRGTESATTLCLTAVVPSPPPPANVSINLTAVVHTVDPRFVSFTLDGSYNRGWFQRDLKNQKLRFLAQQLAPAVLRMGGSGNDYFEYNVPSNATLPLPPSCLPGRSYPTLPATGVCPPWSDSKNCSAMAAADPAFCAAARHQPQPYCCAQCGNKWNATSFPWPHGGAGGCSKYSHYGGGATLTCTCLTQPKFDDLLAFADAVNASLVFGLSFSADVNDTHTTALLQHVANGEHPVWGYEFGNEQKDLVRSAEQLGQLQTLLPMLYANSSAQLPVLIGPDWFDFDRGYLTEINKSGVELHAYTFHEYVGSAVQGTAASLRAALGKQTLAGLQATGAKPEVELWVGEAGGVAGGGIQGFTDGYGGGRWWLASLGVHALAGVSVFCRQDLLGGDYGLLSDDFPWDVAVDPDPAALQEVEPRPDYWTALLWKRLMGRRVLAATIPTPTEDNLFCFAHCSAASPGGVSVALINTHPTSVINVSLTDPELGGSRIEYVLTAVAVHGIALNGRPLVIAGAVGEWELPSLDGAPGTPGAAVAVAAGSYLFLEFPNAQVGVCM
eukprot:m.317555 g.317555  ORF g.317555 m.317555 type:complete len:756 (+) comp27557_c0_seq1:166-2433(+)